jgi:23S rRNA (uracil1939-C5)-methyltransferase
MYRALAQELSRVQGGVAWDLYCGLGLIGLYVAGLFRRIYAIDVEAHHIDLARASAERNGVRNIEFRVGRVETLLRDRRFWLQDGKPDVVMVDPPRAGLHPQAQASLHAARPRAIAYCSCNVQSLVRDVKLFTSGFPRYRIAALHAFDMFPQTNHLETLVILERS